MKILVVGDLVIDQYKMCQATRICPEAPVPVLIQQKPTYETIGGAGLVYNQLLELTDGIHAVYGSKSRKERIFADGRLICRLDYDSLEITANFEKRVHEILEESKPPILIISDYGKGAFIEESAKRIMKKTHQLGIKVLVDAKHNWDFYDLAFAIFPNQHEKWNTEVRAQHAIQKMGADGCMVDGVHVPTLEVEARDTTGAGDVFLAAFAYSLNNYGEGLENQLTMAAEYANLVAGLSVVHVGTHVVTKQEIRNAYESY